jgi:hypothetical protein
MLRRNIYTLTILKECLLGPGKHTRTIDFAPDIEGKVDKLFTLPLACFSTCYYVLNNKNIKPLSSPSPSLPRTVTDAK